jgi:hypothetical protein
VSSVGLTPYPSSSPLGPFGLQGELGSSNCTLELRHAK